MTVTINESTSLSARMVNSSNYPPIIACSWKTSPVFGSFSFPRSNVSLFVWLIVFRCRIKVIISKTCVVTPDIYHTTQYNTMQSNSCIIVNILFMAPRMVYCSMIDLLWSFMSKRVRRFGPSATDLVRRNLRQHTRHQYVDKVRS